MSTKSVNIPLSGLSTSPSDYQVSDGHLAAAIGVVHEDGAIRNAVHTSPKITKRLKEYYQDEIMGHIINHGSARVVYCHENDNYKHLIIESEYSLGSDKGYTYYFADFGSDIAEEKPSNKIVSLKNKCLNITSIGNILRIASEDDTHYFRWGQKKMQDDTYSDFMYMPLTSKMPELKISFSLIPHLYRKLTHGYDQNTEDDDSYKTRLPFFALSSDHSGTTFNDEESLSATECIHGLINQFQKEFCEENNYFSQPFLIRYAYRLYDGSLIMHSSPIFMLPADSMNPSCPIAYFYSGDYTNRHEIYADCIGIGCSVDYKVLNYNTIKEDLEPWSGIIKSVDFFVSSPFYTFDYNGKITQIHSLFPSSKEEDEAEEQMRNYLGRSLHAMLGPKIGSFGTISQCRLDGTEKGYSLSKVMEHEGLYGDYDASDYEVEFARTNLNGENKCYNWRYKFKNKKTGEYDIVYLPQYNDLFSDDHWNVIFSKNIKNGYVPMGYFEIPESKKTISANVKECGNFYLVSSVDLNDLNVSGDFSNLSMETSSLSSLETNESMSDDFESHFEYKTNQTPVVYNNRLNLFNISKIKFDGYELDSMLQNYNAPDYEYEYYMYFKSNKGYYVKKVNGDRRSEGLYFYYPDTTAYKLLILVNIKIAGVYLRADLQMQEHSMLNGSYLFTLWKDIKFSEIEGDGLKSASEIVEEIRALPEKYKQSEEDFEPGSLRTSEVDNPFVFKAENSEQFSNGKIIALVPAAIALSEGQFGQFPMYCFTTEGIWALSVNDTGGWSAKQPISRDVPLTVDRDGVEHPCILQLDRDVVFATDRGLMLLSGSKVTCISEVFDGTKDEWFDKYASHLANIFEKTNIEYTPDLFVPFREYLRGGNMHYDYTHQRIIISHPDYPFCFVFSMKDRLWSAININVTSGINSYPESYAMATETEGDNLHNVMIDFTSHDPKGDNITMPSDGYLLTRPLKLGAPDLLKVIRSINLRGVFHEESRVTPSKDFQAHTFGMILYGTNDPAMLQWHVVGSVMGSRMQFRYGSPYKAFRLAIISHMQEGESLSHAEVVYEIRETDKTR